MVSGPGQAEPRVAFVAGATGYVGREVVRALAARGAQAWAHVRPDSARLAEWRARFEALGAEVDATAWDEGAMTQTLVALRPRAVFALLGTTRARGGSYEAVDYGLTALLLRAAVRAAEATRVVPRFVYLSSMGASETTGNAYLRVRGRVERELRESGLPYVVARPSFITGPDREESRPMERLGAVAVDALTWPLVLVGARAVRDRWRSTTGRELAEALVRLAWDPAAVGRVVAGDGLR